MYEKIYKFLDTVEQIRLDNDLPKVYYINIGGINVIIQWEDGHDTPNGYNLVLSVNKNNAYFLEDGQPIIESVTLPKKFNIGNQTHLTSYVFYEILTNALVEQVQKNSVENGLQLWIDFSFLESEYDIKVDNCLAIEILSELNQRPEVLDAIIDGNGYDIIIGTSYAPNYDINKSL